MTEKEAKIREMKFNIKGLEEQLSRKEMIGMNKTDTIRK